MRQKYWLISLAVAGTMLLTACGGAAGPEPAPAEPEATDTTEPVAAALPTEEPTEAAPPTEVPTAVIAPPTEEPAEAAAPASAEPTEEVAMVTEEAVVETVDWLTNEGQTEDGFAFLGNPDAPIVLQDYSDFL